MSAARSDAAVVSATCWGEWRGGCLRRRVRRCRSHVPGRHLRTLCRRRAVHCVSERQAHMLVKAIGERMVESDCGYLRTRPRWCTAKGGRRTTDYPTITFTFLGSPSKPERRGTKREILHLVPARSQQGSPQEDSVRRREPYGYTRASAAPSPNSPGKSTSEGQDLQAVPQCDSPGDPTARPLGRALRQRGQRRAADDVMTTAFTEQRVATVPCRSPVRFSTRA